MSSKNVITKKSETRILRKVVSKSKIVTLSKISIFGLPMILSINFSFMCNEGHSRLNTELLKSKFKMIYRKYAGL